MTHSYDNFIPRFWFNIKLLVEGGERESEVERRPDLRGLQHARQGRGQAAAQGEGRLLLLLGSHRLLDPQRANLNFTCFVTNCICRSSPAAACSHRFHKAIEI